MIKLLSLNIENFMNIKSAQFDFDKNIIILSGKSGQGKSAVFDAIALCISQKKRSSTYSEYVKQGCTHSKIVLDCIINNESVNFNLQINLIRGTPYQMELTYKGEKYHNTEADAILKSFDIEYYSDIIFSMQSDDYRDITQLSPTQRSHYLQRLLNFDFQKQKEKINKSLEEFKIQLTKISTDISIKEQFIKRENEEKEDLIEIILTDSDIKKLQNRIIEKQEKINLYQKNQNQVNELNSQNNKISNEILQLNLNKNKIKNKINLIKEKKEQFEETEKKLINTNSEILSLETKIEDLINRLEKNESSAFEDRQVEFEAARHITYYNKLLNEYKNYAVLEEQDKCPMCGQQLQEHLQEEYKRIFLNKEDYIHGSGNETFTGSTFKEKVESITELLQKYTTEKAEYELKKELHLTLNTTHEKDRIISVTKLEKLKEEKIILEKQLKIIEDNFDDSLDLDSELKVITTEISNKNKKLEEIEKEINNFKVEDVTLLSNEIVNDTNIINKYFSDLKINEDIKKRNDKRLENIKLFGREIEKFNSESKNIISEQNVYEDALNILEKTLPNYMVVKTCSSLQTEMNTFIQSIFPNYEVQLINSKKGCEFFYTKDNTIVENTKKRNNAWINSKMSSGFEKALLTTSFKVSLAQLYGINIFIGDELDGAADDESSEKFFEELITNNNFDQLFLISHKKFICQLISDNAENSIIYTANQGKFTITENID